MKRVKGSHGIGAAAKELGAVEQTLRNPVKAAKAGKPLPSGPTITPQPVHEQIAIQHERQTAA